ncbi:AMP-binding protein [Actinokineospora guangxiensis]|uniref:AMP-binding protein n=1 Tax=Actinokineospora guangxiensis TaxID=1490288 RepID=A0ABW0ERW9_9PSEU
MLLTDTRPPATAATVVEQLERLARNVPFGSAYRSAEDGTSLTYRQLHEQASAVAGGLSALVGRGDRVAVALPTSPAGTAVLFGVWMRAATAVVLPVPTGAGASAWNDTALRVVLDSGARVVVVPDGHAVAELTAFLAAGGAEVDVVCTDLLAGAPVAVELPDPEDLAVLQYTSGSTSAPRGVMISHRNIRANVDSIATEMRHRAGPGSGPSALVGWLPLSHDMGLVGVVSCLWSQSPGILMNPSTFVMNPLRWLRAISEHRATGTAAPNFAYQLCVDRARRQSIDDLDLSSLTFAVTGAEMPRRSTIDEFCATFGPRGFDRRAFVPSYGLAEATLLVSGRHGDDGAAVRVFARDSLVVGHRAREARPGENGVEVVSSGAPVSGVTVTIRDDRGASGADGVVGEIVVSGPGVSRGYWGAADPAADGFSESGGLHSFVTSDYGTVIGGEVYVLGRRDDVIVLDGRNLFPEDVERVVAAPIPGVRMARVAALPDPGGAGVVIVAECVRDAQARPSTEVGRDEVVAVVRNRVSGEFGVRTTAVALVRLGQLPLTRSGKVRRKECARLWAHDELKGWA